MINQYTDQYYSLGMNLEDKHANHCMQKNPWNILFEKRKKERKTISYLSHWCKKSEKITLVLQCVPKSSQRVTRSTQCITKSSQCVTKSKFKL